MDFENVARHHNQPELSAHKKAQQSRRSPKRGQTERTPREHLIHLSFPDATRM